MGKGSVSDRAKIRKQVAQAAASMKITKKIKKEKKDNSKVDDFDKLKNLLNLAPPQIDNAMDVETDSDGEMGSKTISNPLKSGRGRNKLINQKMKRLARLKAYTPVRDENPKSLTDKQMEGVKNFADKGKLSRGQRKRLEKKTKFINKTIIEEKGMMTMQKIKDKQREDQLQKNRELAAA
jgi:hypothetical protein